MDRIRGARPAYTFRTSDVLPASGFLKLESVEIMWFIHLDRRPRQTDS